MNQIQTIKEKCLEWGKTCDKQLNWEETQKWCEEQGEGWRLPTLIELYQAYENKVKGFQSGGYWSSTTYAGIPPVAWVVLFGDGGMFNAFKTFGYYVRCCRNVDDSVIKEKKTEKKNKRKDIERLYTNKNMTAREISITSKINQIIDVINNYNL